LAAAGLAAVAAGSASAQVGHPNGHYCPPPCAPQPGCGAPAITQPAWPQGTTDQPGTTATPSMADAPSVGLGAENAGLALGGSSVAMVSPGYVDFAVPITQFRLRYDSAYRNNRPDRAEFFYAKCGCFGTADAKGPPLPETSVDYQELRPYFEYAFSARFSVLIEAPVRFLNPEINANESGFGNLVAGFKYAVIADPCQYLTAQVLVATPTGDTFRGLGNGLTSIEPGVLYYRQLSDRLGLSAEVRDWIPLAGSDFAGNVLRTGLGLGYTAINNCNFRVTPIAEAVGWYVLSGQELADGQAVDAAGDTIVNAKLGVRVGFGPLVGPVANVSRSDLYVGYGRALTGDVWYKDMFRVEYSVRY